jgi:hypothetical protein
VLDTDFTVSGGSGSGGTLTATTAPATGGTLTIYRDIPFTQEDDYVEDDPLPAETLEGGFDRAVMRDQQLQDQVDRAVGLSPAAPIGTSTVLPAPEASTILGWNGTADAIENRVLQDQSDVVSATESDVMAATSFALMVTPGAQRRLVRAFKLCQFQLSR